MSYHYITFGGRIHLPTTTIILPLKWGEFKLAKQQSSSIRPEVLLFLSKGWILVGLGLNDGIQVSTEWGSDLDTSIPSFKRGQQEFNLLNGTIQLMGECLKIVV